MKPAAFKYFSPQTVEEALVHLAEYGDDAKILAGGQSLVPTMNFRLAQPSVLIDLNRIEELFYIKKNSAGLKIGAMTRQRAVERSESILKHAPLIHETMPHIAHPQIRNRGTVGGSLAHADPAAELPAVMIAVDAQFKLRRQKADRTVPAQDFFIDLFYTALEPDEMLAEIRVPAMPENSGWAFREVARRHGDFALVGVAAVVTLDAKSQCQQAKIVLLSVGNAPVEAAQAEQALIGQKPTPAAIRAAAEISGEKDIDPPGDMHASVAYRRHLAKVLTEQALKAAFEKAKE
ncbi:MAG: FAD binding domain-containing protein [bacterium]